MNIKEKVLSLGLPAESFVVVGSGILQALNIRESDDIDLIVSESIFKELQNQKVWKHDQWADQDVLKQDVFDIGTSWDGKDVAMLLTRATFVDDIPYLNLNDLRQWKQDRARQKDLQDILLIDEYLVRQGS